MDYINIQVIFWLRKQEIIVIDISRKNFILLFKFLSQFWKFLYSHAEIY